jgi:carbon monoxide dehydrogenase subunit G
MRSLAIHSLKTAVRRSLMPFKIEEQFEVQAPVQRVWEYLIDPARVVVCIPGAELLESQDERTFVGAVKVKVGPMTMSYKGLMKFIEVDEQGRQVRMVGEGRESGGAGSAKVTMLSKVTPHGGGSLVVVSAEVDLVGKIVQFGRGMIEEVSKQLFRQFSACVKQRLEADNEAQRSETQTPESQPSEKSSETEAQALSVTPLAFHAMWAVIKRFFMRLIGSKA